MLGIDPNMITYQLKFDPNHGLVKQKQRVLAPEYYKVIKMEVDKLLKGGFIWEVDYLI